MVNVQVVMGSRVWQQGSWFGHSAFTSILKCMLLFQKLLSLIDKVCFFGIAVGSFIVVLP